MEEFKPKHANIKVRVFNLSSVNITEGEVSLFKLGLNFVPVTPVSDLETKVSILNFSRKLLLKWRFFNSDFNDPSLIRPESSYIPKMIDSPVLKGVIEDLEIFANEFPSNMNKKIIGDNLTVEQRLGLSTFKKRKGIVLFKADKGSGIVLLDQCFYKSKILNILNSTKYEKLNRNVDYFTMLKLKILVKKFDNILTSTERRAILNLDYRTTNIYGLPKIHKSKIINDAIKDAKSAYLHLPHVFDLSFRLIFGGPKSPCSMLADLLNTLLNPFRDKVKARIKDVYDFIRNIPTFSSEDLPYIELISVDVKSMYENLTQSLGIPALKYFLRKYHNLLPSRFTPEFVIESMIFILNNNTGYFNGEIYRQVTGTATGIKPAPPYADISMGYLEIHLFYKLRAKLGLKIASYFWRHYQRFLDDGIILWDKRLCNFDRVFEILNSMDPSISFTLERSNSNLKFLDVLVYKTESGFKTVVQGKDTDCDTFLNFASSHPRHCRENIPFSMARRVKTLTDDTELASQEMEKLSVKLKKSGYPIGIVNSAVQSAMVLSTEELRKQSIKQPSDNIITFVHTFDPAYPGLLGQIKSLVSRIFTSPECRHVFENTKIIDSRKEPPSLIRSLQHSRFDEFGTKASMKGVKRCKQPNCRVCGEIMETDRVWFRNAGCAFTINSSMDCTVRNVIYALFCVGCSQSYIGETVDLRHRASSHRSNAKDEDRAVMRVSRHLYRCGRGFKICPILKIREESKILRLVMEDHCIKLLKPDLNADQRNLLHLNLKS